MLRKLKIKDKSNFIYFAKNNNISTYLFSDFIKLKKLAFISEVDGLIKGLIFVEKDEEYYLNLITDNKKIANNLLKIFFWNWKKDILAKINENNDLGFILKNNGFRIVNKQDDVFLLKYNPINKGKNYGRRYNSKHNRID